MTKKEHDFECDEPRQIFYTFKEHTELIDLIRRFPSVIDDLRAKERCYERFLCMCWTDCRLSPETNLLTSFFGTFFEVICDSYQEQPHLFDPHLRGIFDILIETVRNTENMNLVHESFKYMHCVTKVSRKKRSFFA
jgi:hypothetical protein